jgi:hypothetical protein
MEGLNGFTRCGRIQGHDAVSFATKVEEGDVVRARCHNLGGISDEVKSGVKKSQKERKRGFILQYKQLHAHKY